MGIVYLARDVALERPVAIKVLAPALAARRDMRERFLREARTAAQCFHPHIVPIHAVEEADDLAWIVMAYVRGETLAARLRRTGTMPADELRRLAREVGCALSYAHQCGIVHRDITPENLLIVASTGRYVIADFGIAHLIDQHITPVGGSVAGTARYMAPEQALGEAIDGRADLYALGVTLFIAVTGRAPFDGKSALALVAEHMTQIVPSVRSFAPTVPLPLARAIDRCLAKRPDDRFVDAGQFLAAMAVRGTEALIESRRLLRQGHSPADIERAMLGDDASIASNRGVLRGRRAGLAQLIIGVALAFGQARLRGLKLSEPFGDIVQLATLLLPPTLMARGAGSLLGSTGIGAWIRRAVGAPLARLVTRVERFVATHRDTRTAARRTRRSAGATTDRHGRPGIAPARHAAAG